MMSNDSTTLARTDTLYGLERASARKDRQTAEQPALMDPRAGHGSSR